MERCIESYWAIIIKLPRRDVIDCNARQYGWIADDLYRRCSDPVRCDSQSNDSFDMCLLGHSWVKRHTRAYNVGYWLSLLSGAECCSKATYKKSQHYYPLRAGVKFPSLCTAHCASFVNSFRLTGSLICPCYRREHPLGQDDCGHSSKVGASS